ncbi:YdcF family protein [Arthrobacter sp. KNU-44]|uniref:YdcF family protein n=1 Tax=unclassified Arthrobacter TaxID=235627 RepID=UPI003F43A6BB
MTSTMIPEKRTAPRRKRRKHIISIIVLCVSPVLLWATAGLFLYVEPPADAPKHADVLFVLGPADDRVDYAEKLMDQGYAHTLVISVPQGVAGYPRLTLCDEQRPYRIICFKPDPGTTQGEARELRTLAQENGWKSANVLTAQYHVTRARVIVQRCFQGELNMVSYQKDLPLLSTKKSTPSWAYMYAYQTAAFVKVALNQEC